MENVIATADHAMTDRDVEFFFKAPVNDGGVWNLFYNIAEKYGVVPQEVMPETAHSNNTSQMSNVINERLRAGGYALRELIHSGAKKKAVKEAKLEILEDVNFELNKGEVVYLIGKVGSGKTSFLKTVYGELDIHSGEAEVMGCNLRTMKQKHIPDLRRRLGIVFQDFQLLTDRTVHANLEFVLRATGWKNKVDIHMRIEEVLEQVGMSGKGYKMPNELSGGEQQRIAIARAILNKPELILADEPTGNLDVETGQRIVELLKEICAQGSAILMITHNLNMLSEYPGKVYQFENHHIEEVTAQFCNISEQNVE